MKILRILAAALTFVLLTTCAANKAEPTPGVTDAPETPPDQEMVWVPEFIALPREVTDLFRPMMIDGAVYFTMSVKVGTRQSSNPNSELDVAAGDSRYDIFENQVFKINPDGSGFERADTFPAIYADDSLLSPEGFDISPIIELGYAESELYPLGEIEGGRILVANRANTEFITLRLVPAKSVKPKIELTMAAFTLNQNIREAVTEFNRVNQEYAIIVTEYNDIYDTSRTASVKLNTEIAAGVIPDIFALYMMPYDTYANKGLLEDLRPYLDAETEIVPEIAKLLGTSCGELYRVAPRVNVITMTGNADYIGADVGWTIDELNEALAAAEIGAKAVPNSCTRSEILSNVINFNSNEYIDLKNGECNFDTPEFAKLLEFIKSFPESPNYSSGSDEQSAIMGGRLLVHQTIYNGFGSVLTEEIRLGGKVAYKGFPCESRNGSVAETVETLAISSVSEHKDAAWSFIRQFLTPDYQRGMFDGFPSNKILFNEQAAYWTTDTYDENGKLIPKGYIYKGYTSEIESTYGAMSLEQLNKFRVFLRSVDSMTSYDWTLGEIISQEAAAFFAGDKTAEETAALIQNRVGLYVGERQ